MIALGTKLGRYEIRSQLGVGGMSEVYLAQDTKLDRKVALKILPVIYSLYAPTIWRISVDGGPPTKVADAQAFTLQVSPDGKLLAYVGLDPETSRERLTVLALDSGAVVKKLDLPVTARVLFRWSPDSRGFAYVDTRGDVSNLWRVPLEGGPPAQVTDFKTDHIYFFAYSRDGKQLALLRGNQTRDALMISDEQ